MPTSSIRRVPLTVLVALVLAIGSLAGASAQGGAGDQATGPASQTVDTDGITQTIDSDMADDLLAVLVGLLDDLVNPPLLGGPTGADVLRFCGVFVAPGKTVEAARIEAQRLGLRVVEGNQETVGRFLIQQCSTVSPIHNRYFLRDFSGFTVFAV